jgi:UDP-2-acetamido-3-amino-2,3-dideoxy-glucuronate N-acetyltransferase
MANKIGGNSMINIAVVGSGYWGKNLVRNFHSLGSLKAIVDKNPGVLSHLEKKYTDIPCVSNCDQLLNSDKFHIDGIVIATPAETHYNLAKKALFAGMNFLAL